MGLLHFLLMMLGVVVEESNLDEAEQRKSERTLVITIFAVSAAVIIVLSLHFLGLLPE